MQGSGVGCPAKVIEFSFKIVQINAPNDFNSASIRCARLNPTLCPQEKLLRIFQVLQSRTFKLHLYFRRARVRAALRAPIERPRPPLVRAARRAASEREARDRRRAAERACFCNALGDAAL